MAGRQPERMVLLISIVERGSGNKLNKLYRENPHWQALTLLPYHILSLSR